MNIDWMSKRALYLALSGLVIAVGIYSLATWGLTLGIDFKGGSLLEYKLPREVAPKEIDFASVQKTGENTYIFKVESIEENQKEEIKKKLESIVGGEVQELRFETVGPTIGPELVKKTIYALIISAVAILLWIAYQFKSIKFGASAILAMFHDSLVLVGLFSLLGHFSSAEVDFLFVTALLTTLSFSVHDTIVVYDRIREIKKKHGGELKDVANKAINETMRRSINNSLTIVFMLLALIAFGGTNIKWFAIALLIGTISGTYSSPFVAVPLLVSWEEVVKRVRK